jgi:hypothetical protein
MPRRSLPTLSAGEAGEWTETHSGPFLCEPHFSQSLVRGLAILSCFTPEQPLLGIAELADMLGLSRSTTHRYVITLAALGYLKQSIRRKYRLSFGVTRLGVGTNERHRSQGARPTAPE